jgi:hypothetical protein
MQQIGASMYQQPSGADQATGQPGNGSGGPSSDDVVEGEFEEARG